MPVSIVPSITSSASAGTRRSTVLPRTTLMGSFASPPATPNSSMSICSFCGPMKATSGGQPRTIAHGSSSPFALCFFQWT